MSSQAGPPCPLPPPVPPTPPLPSPTTLPTAPPQPPPPHLSCPAPPLPPSLPTKISPAGLRGLSNSSTVLCSPTQSLVQAVDRATKFQPSLSGKTFLCYNHHTMPRLQEGPQCGLVALAMAGGEKVAVDKVQEQAIMKGYSKQGEMFSVDNMAELAHTVLGRETMIASTDDLRDSMNLLDDMESGWVLLVPYDCAHNHSPALLQGKKAHWALITGFILAVDNAEDISDIGPHVKEDNINIVKEIVDKEKLAKLLSRPDSKFLLVARQSKSLVLGLWDKEELISSNNNLKIVEFKGDISEFVIPEGGIVAGLCGRMVKVKLD